MSEMVSDQEISRFILKGAMLLDKDDIETWLESFVDTAQYIVLPRENRVQGLSVGLMHCSNKAILVDRVAVLRHASKFNPHYDRHIMGQSLIERDESGAITVETSFIVVQTTLGGVTTLFCSGGYEDQIIVENGKPKLKKRVVLLDTFCVPNLLATPL
jgi:anthranilate 1,2-dioxygenase small subunit